MKCSRMAVGRPQLALECAPHGEGMKNVDNRHAWVTRLAEFATRNRRTPQHTGYVARQGAPWACGAGESPLSRASRREAGSASSLGCRLGVGVQAAAAAGPPWPGVGGASCSAGALNGSAADELAASPSCTAGATATGVGAMRRLCLVFCGAAAALSGGKSDAAGSCGRGAATGSMRRTGTAATCLGPTSPVAESLGASRHAASCTSTQ